MFFNSSLSIKKSGFLLFLFLLNLPVFANEIDSLRHYNLDTIVVSTFKHENRTLAIPMSATVLNNRQMEKQQLNEMKDFTGVIPNFIIIDRDTRLTSSVFIRGVGALINTPGVAMYVDGIPHFEKSSFDINLLDVEKVEFLRGPQGTLYGRNAMGGIILVHTRSPFRYQGTRLQLRYGSYDETSVAVSHLGKASDKLAYGIAGNYNYYGGHITNVHTAKKANHLKSASVNMRLEWRPMSQMHIRLINNFEHTNQGAFSYGEVNEKTLLVDSVSTNHPSYYKRKLYDGGLQINYYNEYFAIRSQTSVQYLDDRYEVDQDGSPKDLYYAIQSEKQRLVSEEIIVKGLNDSFYGWNFGVFAFNHNIDRATDVFMNFANPKYKLEKRYDDYSRGIALFHQSSLNITSKLRLEAGLRYDYEKANSVHKEHKIIDGNQELINDFDSPLTFSQWTPKASLQYFFMPELQLYFTVAKGYKTGGFNTVFDTPEQRTFEPEYSWNYELGSKGWIIPGKLQAEVALFYIKTHNQQVKQHLNQQGIKIFNAGSSVSKGLEATVNVTPFKNFRLDAAYGLTHATFTKYQYSDEIDYSGNFLPFVPRNTVSVSAEYALQINNEFSDEITFNANYTGIGDMYWHEKNTVKQPFYGLLNASITARNDNVSYSIWGKNITNTQYLGYFYEVGGKKRGKPGRPLSVGVSLSLNF